MERNEILHWLREDDAALSELWRRADRVRRRAVGDEVYLRGLVEFSNRCSRACAYCGISAVSGSSVPRYTLSDEEILACARRAVALDYGTIVMQAGEDAALPAERLAGLIRRIKDETGLVVTLSVGEHDRDALALWRRAGADRYLLRFETSHRPLYDRIHPPRGVRRSDRPAMLRELIDLGYEVGSGALVGVPGQTYDMLADDVVMFRTLGLDMIGTGPYVPHPGTPLGRGTPDPVPDQAPATPEMTWKVLALGRIVCPDSNIPATTALGTLDPAEGQALGLARGANVLMPNLTPARYRPLYEIYPAKAGVGESPAETDARLCAMIERMGRSVGRGRGDSPHHLARVHGAEETAR